jgi:UDP-N-acetylglucosamine/UDP-N-acetylgalactosamine diphosphorylase
MKTVPEELLQRLRRHGQEHVLAWWDRLTADERRGLVEQLNALDLERLAELFDRRDHPQPAPPVEAIQPIPVIRLGQDEPAARRRGEVALRRGEVAVVLVAGGQGSRLGFEHPKGMFAVGPVSGKSLFQVHAEKILALRRRYGKPVPLLIMTSDATHDETTAFFEQHRRFGLPAEEVAFFRQGTMPALDLASGRLLMEKPGRLFTSPNGHGGTLTALADSGLLGRMRDAGVKEVFYFQVDNPLVKVADPVFLGHHLAADAEASSKIVPKEKPTDKVGNLVQIDGRCWIIEYSDLPPELARQTDEQGRLRLWAGNPAIHLFSVDFLDRVTRDGAAGLPFHLARKKVPFLDAAGNAVQPEKENALKFEMFIFDVLPLAERWTVVETTHREEFAPLKNATGADSPESVARAITDLAADWLEKAGVAVPRRPDGAPAYPLEVSPLLALDVEELAARVDRGLSIAAPTYLH